jgi:hypothetical protein
MIYKTSSPKPNHVRVVFELPASLWADQVFLVGDFNGWNPCATAFIQDRNGVWRVALDLPAETRHEFFYWIDGHCHPDAHADGWSTHDEGLPNSIIDATIAPLSGNENDPLLLPDQAFAGPVVSSVHRLLDTEAGAIACVQIRSRYDKER